MIIRKLHILFLIGFFVLNSCNQSESLEGWPKNQISIQAETDLTIGLEHQPFDYHLGEPVAVRTDSNGHIYIADKASLTIKVFSEEGEYLRSLGGRGRGPGEFHDINLMEITDEEDILILDRGLLQFVYITKEGEFISSHPVDLSGQLSQYYPTSVLFTGEYTLGLFLNGAFPDRSPMFQRELFHIYSRDFQTKIRAFFPFDELPIEDEFAWVNFVLNPGSITFLPFGKQFIYSPSIYTGNIYLFEQDGEKWDGWHLEKVFESITPPSEPYQAYETEVEFEKHKDLPGSRWLRFSGIPYYGRVQHMDAGLHWLDNHRFVQFFTVWQQPDSNGTEQNMFKTDIYAQIITTDGEIEKFGYLSTVLTGEPYFRYPLINWKDKKDRFYMIDYSNGYPVVKRFMIDLENPA